MGLENMPIGVNDFRWRHKRSPWLFRKRTWDQEGESSQNRFWLSIEAVGGSGSVNRLEITSFPRAQDDISRIGRLLTVILSSTATNNLKVNPLTSSKDDTTTDLVGNPMNDVD